MGCDRDRVYLFQGRVGNRIHIESLYPCQDCSASIFNHQSHSFSLVSLLSRLPSPSPPTPICSVKFPPLRNRILTTQRTTHHAPRLLPTPDCSHMPASTRGARSASGSTARTRRRRRSARPRARRSRSSTRATRRSRWRAGSSGRRTPCTRSASRSSFSVSTVVVQKI